VVFPVEGEDKLMGRTYQDLLADARERVPEVQVAELAERLEGGETPLIIDVREQQEWDEGHIPGAVHVPRGFLESRIAGVAKPDQEMVLSCAGGVRSLLAATTLQDMGYANVTSLAGGFTRWKQSGQEVKLPRTLTPDQRNRYSRHVLVPEVGEEGQLKLLDSKVLLIGAGGLGSPAAYYLAAAGVGTLGLVDDDVVDASNLQRQIIHTTDRVGMLKGESAKMAINALNPDVTVNVHPFRVNKENVLDLIADYDVIVDGADNFPTRYLMSDAALMARKPLVHASILRFEGHASVFLPYDGPCYRCLFPEPPPPDMAPSCGEAGVLGVLCGVMGNIQANEAIKVLLGIGDTLSGRLMLYDALGMTFTELKVRRDPNCPACSPGATLEFRDYDAWCAGERDHAPVATGVAG
jgi:molybdopterin/thiamine biosynthesis adenylyltransferase/rhodanese-related sulfurtransferase